MHAPPSSLTNLTNLTPAELAQLLVQAGSEHATEATVLDDLANGAPTNEDGTINLIAYTAWQVRVLTHGS